MDSTWYSFWRPNTQYVRQHFQYVRDAFGRLVWQLQDTIGYEAVPWDDGTPETSDTGWDYRPGLPNWFRYWRRLPNGRFAVVSDYWEPRSGQRVRIG